jgi:hypothetical protein
MSIGDAAAWHHKDGFPVFDFCGDDFVRLSTYEAACEKHTKILGSAPMLLEALEERATLLGCLDWSNLPEGGVSAYMKATEALKAAKGQQ